MAIVLCKQQPIKIGTKIAKLVAIGPAFSVRRIRNGRFDGPHPVQLFRCECGAVAVLNVSGLVNGRTVSCGCRHRQILKTSGLNRLRHGDSFTPLHNLWRSIKQRCYDPTQENYERYGARGIRVCQAWIDSYETFRDYALSHGWRHGLQIDRWPNNNGNYEPGNIRFVTSKDNNRNKRNTPFLTAWQETKPLMEWIEDDRCQVSYPCLYSRLFRRRGRLWTTEEAISTPPRW